MSARNLTQLLGKIVLVLLVVGALSAPTERAAAQDMERLRGVIAEATKLAYEGKYDDAITKYFEAKTIHDDPLLDYNIARCYHKKGDCEQAKRFYASVIERGEADTDTLRDAKKYDEELGVCKTEETVVAQPDPGPQPDDPVVEDKSDGGMSTMAYAGWGASIGGGLFILTGLALDISGASLQDDYEAAAAAGDKAKYDSLKDDIDSRKTTVYALYGLGLVSAITGGVLLYLDSQAGSSEGASLAPMLGPDHAGAVLNLSF